VIAKEWFAKKACVSSNCQNVGVVPISNEYYHRKRRGGNERMISYVILVFSSKLKANKRFLAFEAICVAFLVVVEGWNW